MSRLPRVAAAQARLTAARERLAVALQEVEDAERDLSQARVAVAAALLADPELGVAPDACLAERHGCTSSYVAWVRRGRGLPSSRARSSKAVEQTILRELAEGVRTTARLKRCVPERTMWSVLWRLVDQGVVERVRPGAYRLRDVDVPAANNDSPLTRAQGA